METPDKSLICVVDNRQSVDYYVSDKKKFSEAEKRFKNNEKNWCCGENIGKLGKGIKPDFSSEAGIGASYIIFNSCLYRMGGLEDDKATRRVSYLDLKKMNNNVWVECPMMNHPRIEPYPVILGGQLYVVGGLFTGYRETPVLMEVLKIDGSGWEDIPNPPPYPEAPQPPTPIVYTPTIHKKEEIDESGIYVSDEEEEEDHPIYVSDEEEEEDHPVNISEKSREVKIEEEFKQPIAIQPPRSGRLSDIKRKEKEKAFFHRIHDRIKSEKEKELEKERKDREYFTRVYAMAIVGVVKRDDRAFIVVGIGAARSLGLYTYEAEENVVRRKWKPYLKMDLSDLHYLDHLPEQSTVVSGQLMLFLGRIEGIDKLFVLDFEKDLLHSYNLSKMIPEIRNNMCNDPFLVKIDEDKFDVFWAVYGPEWKSKTSGKVLGSISTIMSSTLTVKRNEASNTSLCVEVTQKLNWFSLIPELKSYMLQAVLIK